MSRITFVAVAVSLLILVGCVQDQRSHLPVRYYSPAVEKVLETHSQAVWNEVYPKLDEMTEDEVKSELRRLVDEHILPHKDLLRREAELLLARLPKAEPLDRSKWRPYTAHGVTAEKLQQDVNEMLSEVEKDRFRGCLLAFSWDPIRLAHVLNNGTCWTVDGGRPITSLLKSLTVKSIYAVDSNPGRPVFAFPRGPEVIIVALERTEGGYYLPRSVEWLTKQPLPSTRPAQASTLPGK